MQHTVCRGKNAAQSMHHKMWSTICAAKFASNMLNIKYAALNVNYKVCSKIMQLKIYRTICTEMGRTKCAAK